MQPVAPDPRGTRRPFRETDVSKIQGAQKAQPRPVVTTASTDDTAAGIPRPLTEDQGAAVRYGWKPRTGAVGMFPSAKNGCDVPFWNESELAFARQAERASTVERYEARPTSMLGFLPFEYIPSFELSTVYGEMVVEISESGMPTSEEEAWRVSKIRDSIEGTGIMFAQFTSFEASRRKLFGRSRPLRPRTNDYWARSQHAAVAWFWAQFKSPWKSP